MQRRRTTAAAATKQTGLEGVVEMVASDAQRDAAAAKVYVEAEIQKWTTSDGYKTMKKEAELYKKKCEEILQKAKQEGLIVTKDVCKYVVTRMHELGHEIKLEVDKLINDYDSMISQSDAAFMKSLAAQQ